MRRQTSTKVQFGDVTAAEQELAEVMTSGKATAESIGLACHAIGEAACRYDPDGEWDPTKGFKPWFSLSAFGRSYQSGTNDLFAQMLHKSRDGFTTADGKVVKPNPRLKGIPSWAPKARDTEAAHKAACDAAAALWPSVAEAHPDALSVGRFGTLSRPGAAKTARVKATIGGEF